MAWTQYPVFIVGLQRSGTTLLINLVDGCRDAVVLPEETQIFRRRFVEPFLEGFAGDSVQQPRGTAEGLAQLIMERTPLRRLRLSEPTETVDGIINYQNLDAVRFEETLAEKLRDESVFSGGAILTAVARAVYEVAPLYQARPEPKCWFEKTPTNLSRVTYLANWYPRARFIQLVRDPRDNWLSLARKWTDTRLPAVVRLWLRASRAATSNARKLGKDRYLVVRYEDLVLDTDSEMRRVCAFAGLGFSPELLKPTKAGAAWYGNSMFETRNSGIYTMSIGRFQRPAHYSDNARVEAIVGPRHMARWKYETITQPSQAERIRGAYLRLRFYLGDFRKSATGQRRFGNIR